jgi:hypothetical protein
MFSPLNILFDINPSFGINILIILVFINALFYNYLLTITVLTRWN